MCFGVGLFTFIIADAQEIFFDLETPVFQFW